MLRYLQSCVTYLKKTPSKSTELLSVIHPLWQVMEYTVLFVCGPPAGLVLSFAHPVIVHCHMPYLEMVCSSMHHFLPQIRVISSLPRLNIKLSRKKTHLLKFSPLKVGRACLLNLATPGTFTPSFCLCVTCRALEKPPCNKLSSSL